MKAKRRNLSAKKLLRTRKSNAGPPAARGAMRGERNWMAGAEKFYRPIKKPVTLRLDADVLAWFKRLGRGYQTRINATLRNVMMKERKAAK